MKKKLVISDLSNIEGRMLAYLAQERWKLQAFRDFDAGIGPDLYKITAASIIGGDPYDIGGKQRNVFGKVPDLALGFEGGVGALQTFARKFGVQMADYWDVISAGVSQDLIDRAHYNLQTWGEEKREALEITADEWIASEVIKLAWRERHPATRQLWRSVKEACVAAIQNPNITYAAGPKMSARALSHASGDWLLVKLPSGKYLTYLNPAVNNDGGLDYDGYIQTTSGARVWGRNHTYGGKVVENACQAAAGDVLKSSMHAVEAAGYDIVLLVHDEDICETPDSPEYTAERLSEIIATPPSWAPDIPLAAAGSEEKRYCKG